LEYSARFRPRLRVARDAPNFFSLHLDDPAAYVHVRDIPMISSRIRGSLSLSLSRSLALSLLHFQATGTKVHGRRIGYHVTKQSVCRELDEGAM
jgi:hypothetical protein